MGLGAGTGTVPGGATRSVLRSQPAWVRQSAVLRRHAAPGCPADTASTAELTGASGFSWEATFPGGRAGIVSYILARASGL